MAGGSTRYFEPLERWSAALLLVAGGLWTVEAAAMGAREAGVTVPNLVIVVTALPAMLLVLLGAMGFYPDLADEMRWLAVAAVAIAVLAVAAIAVQIAWLLAATLLGVPNPHFLVLAGTLLATGASLILFAAGSTVASPPSRTVGLLLVGFVAVWGLWLVDFFVNLVPGLLEVVLHVLSAATILAAGYLHRTKGSPSGATEAAMRSES